MSKKLFNLDDYKNTEKIRYGMWCKTEDEARRFCNFLDSQGRKWQSGNSYKEENNYTWFANNYGGLIYYFNEGLHTYLFRLNQCITSNAKKAILKFSDYTYPNEDENEDTFENDVNFNLKCDVKLNPETYETIADKVNSLIKEYADKQKEKDNNEEIVDNNKEKRKMLIPKIINHLYEIHEEKSSAKGKNGVDIIYFSELIAKTTLLFENGDKISVSLPATDFNESDLFYIAVAQLATGDGEMGIHYLPEIKYSTPSVLEDGIKTTVIFENGDEISVFYSNYHLDNCIDFHDVTYKSESVAIAKYAMGGGNKIHNERDYWLEKVHKQKIRAIHHIKQSIDEYNSKFPDIYGRELVLDFKEKESENT